MSVIVGADDHATPPAMARDVAGRMPDARITVVPGTRHHTPLEAPDTTARCIRDVIARATSRPLAQEHP
ncbi:MAG TPA: alpha/beta hydrolase [Variovorax sp.]|nr:alpha/beta hydrolase [Variovorax sp.]